MYLLCPVPGVTAGVSTVGINSRQKVKERERDEGHTADLYDIAIARKVPASYLPSKTSSVQAVRLENLHPRDASARLLAPVSSLKLGIRAATNSMTNAKIFTDRAGKNTAKCQIAMNVKYR